MAAELKKLDARDACGARSTVAVDGLATRCGDFVEVRLPCVLPHQAWLHEPTQKAA